MNKIRLQHEQYNAHRFLKALCQQMPVFQLHTKLRETRDVSLIRVEREHHLNGEKSLIIYSESLNVSTLIGVSEALQGVVDVVYFTVKALPSDSSAISVCASVNVVNSVGVNTLLEQVAQQFHVELSLLSTIPSLASPGLLLMDMDSTVIDMECIDEIAHLANVGTEVSEVTELAMQGKLDFTESLYQRVACLQGIDVSLLEGIKDRLPLMPGITHLLSVLQNKGWITAIASGGFTLFADHLKQRLHLDYAISNQLEVKDHVLTGNVLGDVVDAQVKSDTLLELAQRYGIPTEQTIALGDGANDLVMMDTASLGLAYHAKPMVRQQADASVRFYGHEVLLHILNHGAS